MSRCFVECGAESRLFHPYAFIVLSVQWRCCCFCCLVASVVSNPVQPRLACQASLSMGILQARILEWVVIPSSRGSSQPRDWTQISYIVGRFFTTEPPGKTTMGMHAQSLRSCPTLTILWAIAHQAPLSMGILQTRILEWVAMPSSRGSSQPGSESESPALQAVSLPTEPPGKSTIGIVIPIKLLCVLDEFTV